MAGQLSADLATFLGGVAGGSAGGSALHEAALRLLGQAPAAAQRAVLEYYGQVADQMVRLHCRQRHESREYDQGGRCLSALRRQLGQLMGAQPEFWASSVAEWALNLLGMLASKYADQILQSVPGSNALSLHESLPRWLECHPAECLIEITTNCLEILLKAHTSQGTEKAVSVLLDTSAKHSPHFDWVVAHIGSCFPDTIISRVLSVGLKDFCQYASSQLKKDGGGKFNLSKIPKINSVVGILDHLAATHRIEIRTTLNKLILESLSAPKKAMTEEDIAIVPFVLYLASLSEMLVPILSDDLRSKLTPNITKKINYCFDEWEEKFFPEEDSLASLVVHLIIVSEQHTEEIIGVLLDLGASTSDLEEDVQDGARLVMDLLLSELLSMVHQTPKHSPESIPILRGLTANYEHIMTHYLLSDDPFQRKSSIVLLNYCALYQGRTVAVNVVKYCLDHAETQEQLGVMMEFIKDTELWITDIVKVAVSQRIKTKGKKQMTFVRNLGLLLHYQSLPPAEQKVQPLSLFSHTVQKHLVDFLPMLSVLEMVPHVLKVLHFVPLSLEQLSIAQIHRVSHCFVHTIFLLIRDTTIFESTLKTKLVGQCVKNLLVICANSAGQAMTTRFLVEAVFHSKFAPLFGGMGPEGDKNQETLKNTIKLINENLKFGSMPTHPLGTSTAFHAGIIGEGRRPSPKPSPVTPEELDRNQFLIGTVIFKICHHGTRDKSKEACKQLALLLVEIFSPDVMYNGLPWPDEEFMKVTVERDLKIARKMRGHPMVWKLLYGLAESRPSLCYTSVLLRAVMAVQMSFWQASVASKAADCPKELGELKKILELMSVGQFLPHPLNAVSDVLDVFHAFHLHCVLVDVWNFMRCNVPSPVAFASNGEGVVFREFEPYKNYQDYCTRLRLIMVEHIDKIPKEFKRFFVDVSLKSEASLQIAMEY